MTQQLGDGVVARQQLVDQRDRLVAVGGEQLAQGGTQRAHLVELGAGPVVPTGVDVLDVELGEGGDRLQGVRGLCGVREGDRRHQGCLCVMTKNHVDMLHDRASTVMSHDDDHP